MLRKIFAGAAAAMLAIMSLSSCKDTKSYAELLNDENRAVNAFLVNRNVILTIPADTVFETGANAPYYQIDDEGNVFMQVINPGIAGMKAENNQLIYFRFTSYSLYEYDSATNTFTGEAFGNADDMATGSASFRFGNFSSTASSQWGRGIQMPLDFVDLGCELNLVVKSQYGLTSEVASVIPRFYNIRYFKEGTSAE